MTLSTPWRTLPTDNDVSASNGLVENNSKIMVTILLFAGRFYEASYDCLPQMTASINGSVDPSIDKTSHYISLGFEKLWPYEVF